VIRREKGGWKVVSHSGRPLSKVLKTIEAAKKRLSEVEYFKRQK